VTGDRPVEELLRELAPHALGALVRRYGHFDSAEDAIQEALLAAAVQWPRTGLPDNPRAWLIQVASRRLIDLLRADRARQDRETAVLAQTLPAELLAPAADTRPPADADDTLVLLFLCCHPALTPPSQVALTLRAVGGLTTAEIAGALLVPEATVAQRISRAKARIKATGATFRLPGEPEREQRLAAVLHVLYLVFNEGYTASSGPQLQRADLATEAVRLVRLLHRLLPDNPEVTGLLALLLLTDARRAARTDLDGALVPLADQDRRRWDWDTIRTGLALVADALSRRRPGPYQLQAAIAALHDSAPRAEDTDWPQILTLYEALDRLDDNPVVRLNRAVAAAMVHGPRTGLALLEPLDSDQRTASHHRLAAVRAHLLEQAGDTEAAIEQYRTAARLTTSEPEATYLTHRAHTLSRKTNVAGRNRG
jgi:RNA polymerase sigma factor (sigma-70 family)